MPGTIPAGRSGSATRLVCLWLALAAAAPARAQEQDLDELLALSLDDLLRVRVETVLQEPHTLNEVPATVRLITADQIQERGYFTLEDALGDLPGFQFRNIQGFNSYVFLRGVPGQNNTILVMADGVPLNELNSGGFYGGGQYNLAGVQRIEVAYGPASCLYGTNAVSGVVNLITRAPESSRGGQVGLQAGNFATRAADFRYGRQAADGRRGFTLSGLYKHTGKGDLRGREGDGNWTDALDNFETDLSLDGRLRAGSFSAGFDLQDKNASRATVQRTSDVPLSDHGVDWHIRFLNGWASYRHDRKKWSLRSTVYYRGSTVLPDTLPVIELPTADSPGRQFRYYRPGHLVGDETRLLWTPRSRFTLSLGLALEHEWLSERFSISESDSAAERPPAPSDPRSLATDLVSVYAQAEVPLSKGLDAFLGIRHDDSSYHGTVDTPRLGLVFNRDQLTARVLYMEAFRAPRPWDFTDGAGNPDLAPETLRSYEASGAWSFTSNLRLDLSVFHNRLEGLLTRLGEAAEGRWVNAGDLDTDGLELVLEHRRGTLRSFLTYSYTDSRDDLGRRVPEIARHGATAGLAFAASRTVGAGLRCRYLGSRTNPAVIPTTGDDRIEDALVLSATASWKLPRRLTLRLFVDNLTDLEYYHPSNLPPSRYRQPQRCFRLKVEHAF